MKWVHPLKGRKISEALEDALLEDPVVKNLNGRFICIERADLRGRGRMYYDTPAWFALKGLYNLFSHDTMKDCCKYGFKLVKTRNDVYRYEVCAMAVDKR